MENGLMKKEIAKKEAGMKASNAHCTIMTRAASASKAKLENQKRRTCRSVKTSARLVSHPMLIEQHNVDMQAKALRAKESADAEAQKAVSEALREARIQEEMRTRTFTGESNNFFTLQSLTHFQSPCHPTSRRMTSSPSLVHSASRQMAPSLSSQHS